jgi:ATP adenylyltransferase
LDPTRSCSLESIFPYAPEVNEPAPPWPRQLPLPGPGRYIPNMDRLWTPWRYEYIVGEKKPRAKGVPDALIAWLDSGPDGISPDRHCVFCNMIAAVDYAVERGMAPEHAEREALIIARGRSNFLCLNRYPYSTGHLLIVPYQHCDSLNRLPPSTAQEMMEVAQRVEDVLRRVYRPHGLNFGLNVGEAAGAGIADHLHMHALPRWSGDTNFMTVVAQTRVLPETLEITWERVRKAFAEEEAGGSLEELPH